ncbi:MAG: hypothetical protein U0746_07985 [Gemmataceae bacterium]
MSNVTVALTADECSFLEATAAERGCGSVPDVLRQLVRDEQKRNAQRHLESLILEAAESGVVEATPAYWEQLRERVERRLAGRNGS